MRTFLRIGLLSISFLMLSMIPSQLYAQLDSVACPSSAAGGPNDSTDIGRFVIGKDTIGSLYSHLGNSNATVHYVQNPDTIILYVDSTYHLQEASTMKTIHDASARLSMFVDINNDRYYGAGEEIWVAYTTIYQNYILDTDITIPPYVVTDVPIMARVILNNDIATPGDPACGYYTSGETMDLVLMFKVAVDTTVSVKTMQRSSKVSFYPNPSNGRFTMNYLNSQSGNELQLKVVSVTGQMILSRRYDKPGTRFSADIDLGNVAKGLYFVETEVDGVQQLNKILIQ